ncbi:MAG: 50S ribosomal protein L10, partial [Thermoleophilia bacterium]
SQAILVADYRGMTVAEARELRTELKAVGADYQVTKNTLMIRVAEAAELPELGQFLEGPSAIAFCDEEAVGPAKVLMKYVKEFKPLEVKGGIFEGQLADADKIKFLASLPPRDVLIAQMLGGLQGPIRGLATVCAGPIRGLVTALQRIQEQKESEAA